MLNNWDKFMVDQYKKVRSRCRKGIPPSTRPEAWYYLCGAKYLMENPNDENKYQTNTKFEVLCVSSIYLALPKNLGTISRNLPQSFFQYVMLAISNFSNIRVKTNGLTI